MTYDFDKPVPRRGTHCVKWDEAPEGVLPMWVADMDFETAPCVIEALRKRLDHGVFGYNYIPDSFYDSIIWWQSHRHQWTPRREWIQYTSGVVPALSAIVRGLCKPGTPVMFFTPAYNCFFSSVRNNDCRMVEFPLTWSPAEERYSIDFDAFERTIVDEQVYLFILCNPHNPTGRVWTREELTSIAEICARHQVIVLSDEIHCEFLNPELGRPFLPFAPIADAAGCQWVVTSAPNKAFNIAGLMTSYIITPVPEYYAAIERARNINEVCDINCFGFIALEAAYSPEGEEWFTQLNDYIYANYRLFRDTLKAAVPSLPIAPLEGTYLVWIDVAALGYDSQSLVKYLMEERHLWVNPGDMYGKAGFLRVNLATQRANVKEALKRFLPLPKISEVNP